MRNITSLRPKKTKEIFKKLPKFSEVFVPLDVAVVYLKDLYAGVDLPPLNENAVQKELDKAYAKGDAPWRLVVG